jgi:beta-aspartyl-peptidase (threonine type)
MKLLFILLLNSFLLCAVFTLSAQPQTNKYVILIHGGVGTIDRQMPDSIKNEYIISLTKALSIGQIILEQGGTSLDAVEQVVRLMEDDPRFNAGKGAVYTSDGAHELDASIMDGRDLSCGAIAGVKTIKNPISLARLVMEKTPHVLLIGEGAESFGQSMNVDIVPNDFFNTQHRYEQWQKSKNKEVKGTVGCVALDMYGNLASASSTGGTTNKMRGRVGDVPIIGAGNYANNKTCAVTCSGKGELFIKHSVAYNVSALMMYKNYSLKDAAEEMIYKTIAKGNGGLIAVDKDGNYALVYNTDGMFRGVASSSGIFEIKIWE